MQARPLRPVPSSVIKRGLADRIIHSLAGRLVIRGLTRFTFVVFSVSALVALLASKSVLSALLLIFSWLTVVHICIEYVYNQKSSEYGQLFPDERTRLLRTCRDSRLVLSRAHDANESTVPILKLNGNDPYELGFGHGYLMHKEIQHLVNKFRRLLKCRILKRDMPACHVPHTYLEEIRGLVDGYNEAHHLDPDTDEGALTADLVLMYHLLADSKQYDLVKPACTCILFDDQEEKRVLFGRNMDWLSFGSAGSLTLLIRTPTCAYWSPPGFIGVVTGMNPAGLCLAMNVFPGPRKRPVDFDNVDDLGMPSTFLNRLILDTCSSLNDVDLALSMPLNSALGAYHLTICEPSNDPRRNATYSFFGDNTYTVERGIPPGSDYRVVLNRNEETGEESFDSSGRQRAIDARGIRLSQDVASCLRLSSTNTFETVHQFIFEPAKRRLIYTSANGFAGDQPFIAFNYSTLWMN